MAATLRGRATGLLRAWRAPDAGQERLDVAWWPVEDLPEPDLSLSWSGSRASAERL